jgi:hypothetical protein
MEHPEAVIEKARQIECLLQREEAGEFFEQVRAELGLKIKEEYLPKLQSRYAAGGRRFEMLIDGRYGHWQTVNSTMREWLYERKQQDEELRAPQLAEEMEKEFGVRVAAGHINYLLRKRELTHTPGRPRRSTPCKPTPPPPEPSSQLSENVGLFFPGGSQAGDEGHGSRKRRDRGGLSSLSG